MCPATDVMPVSELKPGMRGYGKTVLSGSKVEKFGVKIVDVVPKAGIAGDDLILVRVSGRQIEARGGVALGMSGSPVYVKNKLIGAISMTFAEEDNLLGGVTPVESMTKILGYGPSTGLRPLEEPLRLGNRTYRKLAYCPPECGGGEGTLHASLALAPVLVQGLSERSFRYLRKSFDRGGLETAPVYRMLAGKAGGPDIASGSDLEPGSSIAAQLVKGDINVAAIGTLTAIEGKKVLTFGHPLFRKGEVKYLLADAPVHDVVDAEVPYKMASTGAARGVFVQDRGAALTGVLDKFPELIPVAVTVKDADIGVERDVAVKIIDDRELLPILVLSVMLQAMDNSIDRIGEGTSRISFEMGIRGFGGKIERENMHYSRYDVSLESLSDVFTAMDFIMNNALQDTSLSGVKAKVEINSSVSVATIEKAEVMTEEEKKLAAEMEMANDLLPGVEPKDAGEKIEASKFKHDKFPSLFGTEEEEKKEKGKEGKFDDIDEVPRVAPGEEVGIMVSIRPYRDEPVEETLFVHIPEDMESGPANIDIYSGTRLRRAIPYEVLDLQKEEEFHLQEPKEEDEMAEEEPTPAETFEELVRNFVEMEKSNELVAVVTGAGRNAVKDGRWHKDEREKTIKETPWVLRGGASVQVRVGGFVGVKEGKIKKSRIKSLQER